MFVTIRVKLIKKKQNKIEEKDQKHQHGITSIHNKDLAQNIFIFVICLLSILSLILGLSGNNIEMFEGASTRFAIYFLADMTHAFFALVIIPGTIVICNRDIRLSIKEMFNG